MEETKAQQPEYLDAASPNAMAALSGSEPGNLPILPPASEPNNQWQRIGAQTSDFLADLPEYLGRFFNEYKQLIISVSLFFTAIIALRVVIAVLNAINGIPLVYPFFELIGIVYVTWFVFRYLLKASTRQELAATVASVQKEIAGKQDA